MTRNTNENKMALLDLTTRHTWKVKKREENSVLTVDDIIDPENRTLKIHEFQRAFAGASRMECKLIFRRWWWFKVLSKLFTNVLAEDETDETRGKPIFQKFILRRTNCQNQNLASKVVFLGFFLFVPPQ